VTDSLSIRPCSAYTSQMGSAIKQVERRRVLPIGDAFRRENRDVTADSKLLAAAIDACPENLAIVENGCLLYANRAFAATFRYHHSSLRGEPLARLIPPNQLLACVPETGSGFLPSAFDPPFIAIRRDGSPLRVQMSCGYFQAEERDLLVLHLRESGPEEPNPSAPENSAQMAPLGYLVSAVAHDFNNLLTGILLYCDLLVAGLKTDNPLRAYVAEIRRAGGHSAELIQQLMAVSRPQSYEPGAHSWNHVVSSMRNLLTRLLGENIELKMGLGADGDPECVAMDAVPMRQIILNLLLNARDAMPEGGRITLAVRRCAECRTGSESGLPACVVLAVADTGCGMDAATRSRLFQTSFTTKSAGKGNGLGLATVGRIVKEHGGTVQIESQPQEGTRVSIHLPRARRNAANQSNHKEMKPNKGNAL
jgi:two-component system cell cycle sensor histidine kinase/response regulator CckA